MKPRLVIYLRLIRQGDLKIPKSSRADDGLRRLKLGLPVEPRQLLFKSRVRRPSHDRQFAQRRSIDPGSQLVEMRVEFAPNPCLDVALKK